MLLLMPIHTPILKFTNLLVFLVCLVPGQINQLLIVNFLGNHWNEKVNRRKFLDSIATQAGFDPLSPSDWYTFLSSNSIFKHKVFILYCIGLSYHKFMIS